MTYRLLRKAWLFYVPTKSKDVPWVGDPGTVFRGDCDTFKMVVRKLLWASICSWGESPLLQLHFQRGPQSLKGQEILPNIAIKWECVEFLRVWRESALWPSGEIPGMDPFPWIFLQRPGIHGPTCLTSLVSRSTAHEPKLAIHSVLIVLPVCKGHSCHSQSNSKQTYKLT